MSLKHINIHLLRLPSVEQEDIFIDLSVDMGKSFKIYSNYLGSLNDYEMETFWST